MEPYQTCCFTGHRPEGFFFGRDESHPACQGIKRALGICIRVMEQRGVARFITGMARGVDMWAAEIALELWKDRENPPELMAMVPHPYQTAGWSASDRARYLALLHRMTHSVLLSECNYRGCLHARNRAMVEQSGHMIAVYNGNKRGGTYYTLNYAQKRGLDILIIE